MSFLKVLVETPDTCQSIKDKIIPTGDARAMQVMLNCANYLDRVVMGGVLNSTDTVTLCGTQAEGTITFNGLLEDDTITIGGTGPSQSPSGPDLGLASTMGVLGGSGTVTNTGSTVITGDLGLSPGTSVTGFPPGIVTGTQFVADATAASARTSFLAAKVTLEAMTTNVVLTGQDLGGMTLVPGVYEFATTAGLTGTLTLDGQGNPDALFVFKIGSAITTATSSSVVLINGADANNVFWDLGSAATFGTGTAFQGTVLAESSITFVTGSSLLGRALAKVSVTLDTNAITVPGATPPPSSSGTTFTAKVSPVGDFEFALGANDTEAAANAVIKINAQFGDSITASSVGNVITITANDPGTIGNLIIIASSNQTRATVVAMSGGTAGLVFRYII